MDTAIVTGASSGFHPLPGAFGKPDALYAWL